MSHMQWIYEGIMVNNLVKVLVYFVLFLSYFFLEVPVDFESICRKWSLLFATLFENLVIDFKSYKTSFSG